MPKPSSKALALALMFRKFLRLTRGRVPALRALEVIESEESDPDVESLVATLNSEMNSGSTLSEAAEKHGQLISLSILELLRHAEKTGAWDEILQELIEGLEEGTFQV